MGADLRERKAQLRRRMRAARAAVSSEERAERGRAVAARVLALPQVSEAATVLLFYSFGSEVPTSDLARAMQGAGKRLLLPYLDDETGLEAAEVRPGDPLEPTRYGPKEPSRRVPVDPSGVDVVVAPGLAFDRRGYRLGHGAGHYDRYLRRLKRAARIGIGFAEQLVEEVPSGPNDERLDVVVTDEEVVVPLPVRRPHL